MKWLHQFTNRIQQYFIKNKLIFLLFVIGGVLNTLIFTYCYGNYLPTVAYRNSEDFSYREYMAVFQNEPARPQDVSWLRMNSLIEACVVSDGSGIFTFDEKYPVVKLSGTLSFTGSYQMIVSHNSNLKVGDKVDFKGHTFEVIGSARTLQGMAFIPQDTFVELGCMNEIRSVYIYSANHENPASDRVLALMKGTFTNATGFSGGALHMAESEKDETRLMFALVVFNALLVSLAYSFLLYYLVDSLRTENVISRILGASKLQIIAMVLSETVVLALVANVIGVIIHSVFYDMLFVNLNLETHIQYKMGDYALIIVTLLLLSMLTAIPVLLKMLRVSPIQSRRASQ